MIICLWKDIKKHAPVLPGCYQNVQDDCKVVGKLKV